MKILEAKELSFKYPLCTSYAVKNACFEVNEGEFVVLCGSTGSGKSTLLRMLKNELTPVGEKTGSVLFCGRELSELDGRESSGSIGFVMQDTERQTVCDKVWHELAFGLENLNTPPNVIARRVGEISNYFGIEAWYGKNISSLSGGQKQLLNLASVMVCDPKILILDEPTSQLDPIAAENFISTLKRLNEELSLTVIVAEHRLERLVPICDKLIVMDKGEIAVCGEPKNALSKIKKMPCFHSMPCAVRLYNHLGGDTECPLSVKQGREYIRKNFGNKIRRTDKCEYKHSDKTALELDSVYFRYERALPDVLHKASLKVYEDEILSVVGGNGSGKTTLLKVCTGLLKPYSGNVGLFGKKIKNYSLDELYGKTVAYLPQDVQTLFLKNTVREELEETGADSVNLPFDLTNLYEKHPYDISGGEQQLLALAKVLAKKPKILFTDEITKGLDGEKKLMMARIFAELQKNGTTVVSVTHDLEFASMCSDRVALFFNGEVASEDETSEFFSSNSFYTTPAYAMSRGYYDNAVTLDDVVALCKLNR